MCHVASTSSVSGSDNFSDSGYVSPEGAPSSQISDSSCGNTAFKDNCVKGVSSDYVSGPNTEAINQIEDLGSGSELSNIIEKLMQMLMQIISLLKGEGTTGQTPEISEPDPNIPSDISGDNGSIDNGNSVDVPVDTPVDTPTDVGQPDDVTDISQPVDTTTPVDTQDTTSATGDWSDFKSPEVTFTDNAQNLEGSKIFHSAVPNVEQMMKDTCLDICKKIYSDNSDPQNNFTKLNLVLEDDPNGVAATWGNDNEKTIAISAQYLEKFFHDNSDNYDKVLQEVSGILSHEGTHGYQYTPQNAGGYTPGTDAFGFIEGLADYVRTDTTGFTPPRSPSQGGNWKDGYNTTGFFIDWVVKNVDPDFAIELNHTARDYDNWSWDQACKDITGKGVQELWDQYQASLS